jgi:hypothetical protein
MLTAVSHGDEGPYAASERCEREVPLARLVCRAPSLRRIGKGDDHNERFLSRRSSPPLCEAQPHPSDAFGAGAVDPRRIASLGRLVRCEEHCPTKTRGRPARYNRS